MSPDQVEKVSTNPKLVGWFVGQIMKETKGKYPANLIIQEFEKYKKSE